MVDRRVERTERPRDEGVYSSRIQEEKKEKEKFSEIPPDDEKKILFATFFSYLKKMFDSFSPSKKLAGKVIDQQAIIENLTKFKKLLEKLSKQDLSTSPEFAIELSDTWCILLEDFDQIEIMERKNLAEISTFRKMIDTVKNYPPESEHRFGYYLIQHAGKDWLPFPFLEILENLHKQYTEDPKGSVLLSWIKLIDQVTTNLKNKLPFNP